MLLYTDPIMDRGSVITKSTWIYGVWNDSNYFGILRLLVVYIQYLRNEQR